MIKLAFPFLKNPSKINLSPFFNRFGDRRAILCNRAAVLMNNILFRAGGAILFVLTALCILLFFLKDKASVLILAPITFVVYVAYAVLVVFYPPEKLRDKIFIGHKISVIGFIVCAVPIFLKVVFRISIDTAPFMFLGTLVTVYGIYRLQKTQQ